MSKRSRIFSPLFALAIAAILLVQGCGFHLRGKVTVPTELLSLHIRGGEPDFVERMEKALIFNDVYIAPDSKDAAVLDLDAMSYERTVNTTDEQGRATAYKLEYDVDYRVLSVDGIELKADSLTDSRTLSFSVGQILQIEKEEDFLKEDMEKELVNRLLRQLSRVKPKADSDTEAKAKESS
ncbi:MAG: hypothetical protein KAG66_17125 [Methylococcales bacterium]|nr:hypothetical protein [Methylococcales bacterium]